MLLGGMCGDGRASLGSSGGLGGAPGRQNVNHLALVDILSTRAAHPTIWLLPRRWTPRALPFSPTFSRNFLPGSPGSWRNFRHRSVSFFPTRLVCLGGLQSGLFRPPPYRPIGAGALPTVNREPHSAYLSNRTPLLGAGTKTA